jgi:hypothetical protein
MDPVPAENTTHGHLPEAAPCPASEVRLKENRTSERI